MMLLGSLALPVMAALQPFLLLKSPPLSRMLAVALLNAIRLVYFWIKV